jgi:F-type H+-transporting ATPase subunit a
MIGAILLSIAPLIVPGLMQVLGLLTGLIQAYIFAMLAIVYIASATRASAEREQEAEPEGNEGASQASAPPQAAEAQEGKERHG